MFALQNHRMCEKSKMRGFTLIEIMVVVAIIGILAGIALPNYTDYVRRGKVAEATSALADQKNKMEQYYQDNRTYLDAGGLTAPCAPQPGTTKYFDVACSARTASTFTLRALPKANADLVGFQFTINESGAKTSMYQGVNGTNCWLTSKSSSCL